MAMIIMRGFPAMGNLSLVAVNNDDLNVPEGNITMSFRNKTGAKTPASLHHKNYKHLKFRIMKKLLVFVAVIMGVAFLSSCSSTKIVTDSVGNVDFSDYQTVRIEYQPNEGAQQINAINASRVENALQNEVKKRGLAEVEEADLRIVWGVGIDIQRNYSTHSTYHGHGGYGYRRYGGYSHGSSHSTTQEYTTTTGTFQVALIDARTDQVLWLGTASDAIKGKSKKADEKINEVVEKVFAEFPIQQYS